MTSEFRVDRALGTGILRAIPDLTHFAVHKPSLQVRRAILRLPSASGTSADRERCWFSFDDPVETVIAWELDEVEPALRRIETAAASGQWAVGMVSYDAAPAFDTALHATRNDRVPLVAFGLFASRERIAGPQGGHFVVTDWTSEVAEDRYKADLAAIHEHIAAGDTYQVNHTLRLRSEFEGDPLGLFEALARAQRAEHLCFLDLGEAAVCSASPELLFRKHGDHIESRPMKGTRPRSIDPDTDTRLAYELRTSAKDLAENTMIVDMVRNDLGRIARIGSLDVPALHTIEHYPTVHQMTSTVTARTDADLMGIFTALFPGASITGAPKVATSRIIKNLESSPRGIYCGALGAVGPDGFAEFNIAIRTVWIDSAASCAEYGTGGGIVWDSDPNSEWAEAHQKAAVLRQACRPLRLLETIRWDPQSGPRLLDRHVDRMLAGATHFGFDADEYAIRSLIAAVRLEGPARLRLLLSANGTLDLDIAPLDETATASGGAWVLPLDSEPVNSTDELLRFKTTARSRYDEARARFPEAQDVILWNERREITETTIANLVVEVDGEWLTPPTSSGLLAGTFRDELLELGRIREARVTVDQLRDANRIWLINSVRGWIPVELAPIRNAAPVTS